MPSPSPDWTTVTVAGKYKDYEGNPVAGRVIFTPTAERAVDADQLVMIVGRPISVAINESTGIASIALPATDDPDITPINFTYTVTEDFEFGQTYSIAVPMAKAGTGLDLATVAPQATSEGIPLYYMETLNARDLAQGYAQQAAGSVSLVAWAPNTVYVAGNIRQAPDGSGMRRNANGTSRATFDATEQAAWTAIVGVTGTMEQLAADARYLNMGETITDAELPGRLESSAMQVTDWNLANETGFYWSSSSAANAPAAFYLAGFTVAPSATTSGYQVVTAYANTSGTDSQTWRRTRSGGTWSAWTKIRWSETELDARYAILDGNGDITSTQLPDRLGATAITVTDWNAAVENGWFKSAAGCANTPDNTSCLGFVERFGVSDITQTVYSVSGDSSTDTKMWRRTMNSGVWGSWYRLRIAEAELDARYSPVVVGDANLPGRLKSIPLVVTDANTAQENGYYRLTDTSTNAPPEAGLFWLLHVQADVAGLLYITQTAHAYGTDWANDTKTYRREKNNGTWGSWYRIRQSEAELDLRYGLINRGDLLDVDLTKPGSSTAGEGVVELPGAGTVYSETNSNAPGGRWTILAVLVGQDLKAFSTSPRKIPITSGMTYGVSMDATYSGLQQPFIYLRVAYGDNVGNYLGYTDVVGGTQNLPTIGAFKRVSGYWTAPSNAKTAWIEVYNINTGSSTYTANNYLAISNLRFSHADAVQYDSGWVAPTLLNSWVNYGGSEATAGYRKIGNRVTLRGLIKSGTVSDGTSSGNAFVLPVGYRPTMHNHYVCPSNNAYGQAYVQSTGDVRIQQGSNVWFDLSGISFLVD